MTNHKATTRQWSGIERFVRYGAYDSCLIELRDRVEALEAAAKPVESNCQNTLDGSLLDRLEAEGYGRTHGRKAARVIADWFERQELHIAATQLRMEVG